MKNPHDANAEAALIAAILDEPGILPIVQEIAPADAFYTQEMGAIYRAILSVRLDGRKVDEVVIAHELVRKGDIKFVGSKTDAIRMMKNLRDEYGKGDYQGQAEIVRDLYLRRRTVDDLRQVAIDIGGLDSNTSQVLNDLLNRGQALASLANYRPAVHVGKFVDIVLDRLKDAKEAGEGPPGITTGWEEVDAFFRLVAARLYFVAARPGDGKTTAMMGMVGAAADNGANPFVQSLEMKGEEIIERVIYTRANVDITKGWSGTTTDEEDERIVDEADKLREKPIWIDDAANLTPQDIRARIIENVKRHGSNVVFIDHLHEIKKRKPLPGERMSNIDAISEAVVVLADLAKELNIPIVIMAQMNRDIEKRKGRPRLSDLKGAGKIEERAYVVMFLHPRRREKEGHDVPTDFIIEKNRTGSPGDVAMIFEKDRGRFIAQPAVSDPIPDFGTAWTEREREEDVKQEDQKSAF